MKIKAEIFDRLQYLFEETGFNDHQLHSVITFKEKLDIQVLIQSIKVLFQNNPLLASSYHHNQGEAYWETNELFKIEEAFMLAKNEMDFQKFTNSKTNVLAGPQLKICYYENSKYYLSLVMNHMICDAADFKKYLYQLSYLYSELLMNPAFSMRIEQTKSRSIAIVLDQISFKEKVKALLFHKDESNKTQEIEFPFSKGKNVEPFIESYELPENRFHTLYDYCKERNVTINDVVLTAFYRALSKTLYIENRPLSIPIMIDMRKYIKKSEVRTFANISSTVITSISISTNESYDETLEKVSVLMNKKKKEYMGLNGFVKLSMLDKIFPNKMNDKILKKNLINPPICMTNIGVIDDKKLRFEGTEVENAYVCGSIKYRPHFQIALSCFRDKITFTSNLYGDQKDRETINKFFQLLSEELTL